MSRVKKTRRITDIMPARKADKPFEQPKAKPAKNRKPTRYELDLQAREEKKKRKHKGLPSGSRAHEALEKKAANSKEVKDPRIGSRKKVPLMVEFVNQPEKGRFMPLLKGKNAHSTRLRRYIHRRPRTLERSHPPVAGCWTPVCVRHQPSWNTGKQMPPG